MSLACRLAADAEADLRRLDAWLQEDVLDELERLASDTSPLPNGLLVHEFEGVTGGTEYGIPLTLDRSVDRWCLILLGIEMVPA